MLNASSSATNQASQDREQRRQHILTALRGDANALLERMADALVDLADDQLFGAIEYTLRDLSHDFAARVHQAGLDAGKKRGTSAPVRSARTAKPTRASSTIGPSSG
jgi:hypothetical protein